MPILFVHGVSVRNSQGWPEIEQYLRDYIAPAIANNPDNVLIDRVPWGDLGADPKFKTASIPDTKLFAMGAQEDVDIAALRALQDAVADMPVAETSPVGDGLTGAGLATGQGRLSSLSKNQLSEVLYLSLGLTAAKNLAQKARIAEAFSAVLDRPTLVEELNREAAIDGEAALLIKLVAEAYKNPEQDDLQGQGGQFSGFQELKQRVAEVGSRMVDLPGALAGRAVAFEARKLLKGQLLLFLGDVFVYLANRCTPDGKPGAIPDRVISRLKSCAETPAAKAGEPLIVLTHSMGGQLVYDIVTNFLPKLDSELRIDFWCATASQVALFEELSLFLKQQPKTAEGMISRPDSKYLGYWWNVWDQNDVVSFTGEKVFAGVDDESYDTGMLNIEAHGGYLRRASFFERLRQKVLDARDNNWNRSHK